MVEVNEEQKEVLLAVGIGDGEIAGLAWCREGSGKEHEAVARVDLAVEFGKKLRDLEFEVSNILDMVRYQVARNFGDAAASISALISQMPNLKDAGCDVTGLTRFMIEGAYTGKINAIGGVAKNFQSAGFSGAEILELAKSYSPEQITEFGGIVLKLHENEFSTAQMKAWFNAEMYNTERRGTVAAFAGAIDVLKEAGFSKDDLLAVINVKRGHCKAAEPIKNLAAKAKKLHGLGFKPKDMLELFTDADWVIDALSDVAKVLKAESFTVADLIFAAKTGTPEKIGQLGAGVKKLVAADFTPTQMVKLMGWRSNNYAQMIDMSGRLKAVGFTPADTIALEKNISAERLTILDANLTFLHEVGKTPAEMTKLAKSDNFSQMIEEMKLVYAKGVQVGEAKATAAGAKKVDGTSVAVSGKR